ncbi:TlpA disulfide reductase family protein [Chitinophaga niabensis]|uniref:TlpA family protein disulfide reductase n=1 Tax=Chitinophaga niabensis TaxID=536979 RepID=UPI0031B9BC30
MRFSLLAAILSFAAGTLFAQPKTLQADKIDPAVYARQVAELNEHIGDEKDSAMKASLVRSFVALHPDYYLSLVKFFEMVSNESVDRAERRFEAFAPQLRHSVLGKKVAELIKIRQHILPGQMAPEIIATTAEGQPFKLSDLKGKYVFIDFWASWCGPCRKESPNLVKAYARFKDKNFEIVSFSLDRDAAAWKAAAKEDGYTWPQVSDLKEYQGEAARNYMVVFVPKCFLLGPDGKIIATDLRGDALEKQLEKIFN